MPPSHRDDHRPLVDALKGKPLKFLAAYCDVILAQPMPDAAYDGLLDAMRTVGSRRDAAICPACGGRPHPWEAQTLCSKCRRARWLKARADAACPTPAPGAASAGGPASARAAAANDPS